MIWQLIDSSGIGGIERHIATLATSLRRRGIATEVVLYGDHGAHAWLEQLRAADLPVRILDNTFAGLRRALREARPDLLHTHGYKANILGRVAARLSGIPVLSSFHSGEKAAFPVSAYYLLDNWSSLLAPRIAVSEEIAARIPYPSSHIPNYVLGPSAPPNEPLPRRVGFVGRLSHEKAPDLFCRLAADGPADVEWHVYGGGPMLAELQAAYGARITFHGMVTDLSQAWRSMGLMLMPSRFEGLPLAALEALAHGVPVLASRVGALPDVILEGRTGWTFPPEDLAAARTGLAQWLALDREQQIAMRATCHRHWQAEFSEQKRLDQILAVYRKAGLDV